MEDETTTLAVYDFWRNAHESWRVKAGALRTIPECFSTTVEDAKYDALHQLESRRMKDTMRRGGAEIMRCNAQKSVLAACRRLSTEGQDHASFR